QCEDIRDVLEKQRKHDFSMSLNWLIGVFAMALIGLVCGLFIEIKPWVATIGVGLLLHQIFIIFQNVQSYQNLYISLVTQEFIRYYNTQDNVQLSYITKDGISQSRFLECGLFETPVHYRSTDLIRGDI